MMSAEIMRAKGLDGVVHDMIDDPGQSLTRCGEAIGSHWDLEWDIDDQEQTDCPKCLALRGGTPDLKARILEELDEAEAKAIDSLARYKFAMFGYWSGVWVHLNRVSGAKRPNPFKAFVKLAKELRDAQEAKS